MGGQKLGGWVFYFLVCSLHYKVSASADDFYAGKRVKEKRKKYFQRGAGICPSCHRARGGVHPGPRTDWQFRRANIEEQTYIHAHIKTFNLTFLDCGRKPESPSRWI